MTHRAPLSPSRDALADIYDDAPTTLGAWVLTVVFAATGGLLIAASMVVVALTMLGGF